MTKSNISNEAVRLLEYLQSRAAVPVAEIAGSFSCSFIEAHGFCSELEQQGLVVLTFYDVGDWETSAFRITDAGRNLLNEKPQVEDVTGLQNNN